jgi:hypothetical protein
MNHKRLKPRPTYPIKRSGVRRMVSRTSIRKYGKDATKLETQEYVIERNKSNSQMQPNRSGHVRQGDCTQEDKPTQGVSGTIPRVSPR